MSNLDLAVSLARQRELIKPRGSSSISRMSAVLSDGTAIFIGYNSYKTHPFVARFSDNLQRICIHAEMDCLIKATQYFARITGVSYKSMRAKPGCETGGRASITNRLRGNLSGFELSVARVLADGSTGLAKPCPTCQRAIEYFGINKTEFTK